MTRTLKAGVLTGALAAAMVLGGCSKSDDHATHEPTATTSSHDHHAMEHPMDGGQPPAGITEARNPKYPVGTEVKLTADHMPSMEGGKAKISAAYKTYTYSVNYTPTDGSAPVKDHRWVVQEELAQAGKERLPDGTAVIIEADHMAGMKGAKGSIAYSTDETVYMVDYQADGMTMTNHKWVTESEIRALG